MMQSVTKIAACAGLALGASVACADLDLVLFQVEDLFVLHQNSGSPDQFFVGNNPSAIALVDGDLYVAGFNFNAPWAQVTRIDDVFGSRSFTPLIDFADPMGVLNPDQDITLSSRRVVPPSLGFNGMDYVPGLGLLVAVDRGPAPALGAEGQSMLYDVDTQITPIPVATPDLFTTRRASGGIAWDQGFNGLGIDWSDPGGNQDGSLDGPVVALPDGRDASSGPELLRGPYGLDPATLDGTPFVGPYDVTRNGPILEPVNGNGVLWRDIDIDPNTGDIAMRVDGDLIIGIRASDNSVSTRIRIDEGFGQQVGQNVEILHNICDDAGQPSNAILYNPRINGSGGQSFFSSVKFVDMSGNPVTANFLKPDLTTPVGEAVDLADAIANFNIPTGNGYYSYSWDEANQILAVCDFSARLVYFFQPLAKVTPDCAGDLTTTGAGEGQPGFGVPDGVTNLSDLLYFVNIWNTDLGTPSPNPGSQADVTTTGASDGQPGFGVPDGNVDLSDLLYYVNEWTAGLSDCPG